MNKSAEKGLPRIILELYASAKNSSPLAQPCADTLSAGIRFLCRSRTPPSAQDLLLDQVRKTNKMILKYYFRAGEQRNLTALYSHDNYTNYSPLNWW